MRILWVFVVIGEKGYNGFLFYIGCICVLSKVYFIMFINGNIFVIIEKLDNIFCY